VLHHLPIALAAFCLRTVHRIVGSWPRALLLYGVASTLLSTALGLSLRRLVSRMRVGVGVSAILVVGSLVELMLFVALIVGTHGFALEEPDLRGVPWAWITDLSAHDPLRRMPLLVIVFAAPSLWMWIKCTHPTWRGIAFQVLIAVASALAAALSSAASGIGLIGRSIGGPLLLVALWAVRTRAPAVVRKPTVGAAHP